MRSNILRLSINITTLLVISVSYGQNTWIKSYGGAWFDRAMSVVQTADSTYTVIGTTESFGYGSPEASDIWLIKANLSGDTILSKTYGEDAIIEEAYSIIETLTHDYVFSGTIMSEEGGIWLVKIDQAGDTLWTRTFGVGEFAISIGSSVIETTDEGYLICGKVLSFDEPEKDLLLIKTDINGDTLWTRGYNMGLNDATHSVLETHDQEYLVVGTSDDGDCWILKTDANGDTLWTETYGCAGFHAAYDLVRTDDQCFVITGFTASFESTQGDFWLFKIDSNGEIVWSHTYGDYHNEITSSLVQTNDGGFLMVGQKQNAGLANNDDLGWMVKTDSDGEVMWTRTYGSHGYNEMKAVIQTYDNGFLVVGRDSNADFWIIKTDSMGQTSTSALIPTEKSDSFFRQITISPNPTNSTCNIGYTLPVRSSVVLDIYDLSGTKIWSRKFSEQEAGRYNQFWNGTTNNGFELSSGLYFLRVSALSWHENRTIIFLK